MPTPPRKARGTKHARSWQKIIPNAHRARKRMLDMVRCRRPNLSDKNPRANAAI